MATLTLPAPPRASTPTTSSLTHQLQQLDGEKTPTSSLVPRIHSPKPRSLSDAPKPSLSPSPAFREPTRPQSKDDSSISGPTTPRKPPFPTRGLSLQMPFKDGPDTAIPFSSRISIDTSQVYGSPASMLPRRSRGLDYTRACTNLHHSTLAESSPDASPTIGGRGIQIPQRRSMGHTVLDSPSNMSSSLWSTMPGGEKTALSSSVSSINMLDSDADSDSSSEDVVMDQESEDPVMNTPAASKLNGNFMTDTMSSPGGEWLTQNSAAVNSLMSFRRARLRKGKSRHSSSSVSLNSSKRSPGPLSPVMKSVENGNHGYFSTGITRQQILSRRESLSLGTDGLHLSDSEEGERRMNSTLTTAVDSSVDSPRVVRRAVTRRSNMLPKTKNFARIRAALLEESAPADSEAKREAQVIRQVHENDPVVELTTSPVLQPSQPPNDEAFDDSVDDHAISQQTRSTMSSESFKSHAERNSAGLGFWQAFDQRYRTPPPPSLIPRESSIGMSDESIGTPDMTDNPALQHLHRSRSRSITPLAAFAGPTAGEVARKVNNKRRREDDFDSASFKRRAVSPGMSVASSPVMPQSPVFTSDKSWGHPPPKNPADRNNSGGSVSNGIKRVGLQGMTDTHDGLMSMTLD